MKNIFFASALFLTLSTVVSANVSAPAQPANQQAISDDAKLQQNIEMSQAETLAWLGLVDKGQYGDSWSRGSLMFRNTIKKDEWIKAMEKIRKPLGALVARSNLDIRTAKDPHGLPAGDYMVFFYKSSFAHQNEAFELVTLVQESDGQWRVLTYQVN